MIKVNLMIIMIGYFWKSGGYKCESEPIDTDSPADNLNDNPPPRLLFQKPNLMLSKNQFSHMKIVCFILLI